MLFRPNKEWSITSVSDTGPKRCKGRRGDACEEESDAPITPWGLNLLRRVKGTIGRCASGVEGRGPGQWGNDADVAGAQMRTQDRIEQKSDSMPGGALFQNRAILLGMRRPGRGITVLATPVDDVVH